MGVSSRILHFFLIIILRRWWEGTHRFSLLPHVFSREIEGDLQRVQAVLSTSVSHSRGSSGSGIPGMSGWLLLCVICQLKMVC